MISQAIQTINSIRILDISRNDNLLNLIFAKEIIRKRRIIL